MTNNPVPALIRTAFQAAGRRAAGQADLTAAAVAGLRKLRRALADQAGNNAAYQVVDGPLAGFILERNLRELARTGHEPEPVPLPASLPLAGPGAAIMLDAVGNGLVLHRYIEGNAALTGMVPELATCLCEALGGTPDTGALLDLLRGGETADEPAIEAEDNGPRRLH